MALRSFLSRCGAEDYVGQFLTHGFDADTTTVELWRAGITEGDLKEMGLNMKTRKCVWNALKEDNMVAVGSSGATGAATSIATATTDSNSSRGGSSSRSSGQTGTGASAVAVPATGFAEQLWDCFMTVHEDIRQQTQAYAALSRYIHGRLQLEQEYRRRMSALAEQLEASATGGHADEHNNVLLRPYLLVFGAVASSSASAADVREARSSGLEHNLQELSSLVRSQTAALEQLSSEHARLRMRMKQAYANLEREQTTFIQATTTAMSAAASEGVGSNSTRDSQMLASVPQTAAQEEAA